MNGLMQSSRLQNLVCASTLLCASAIYAQLVYKCRPGMARLSTALPIIACNIWLPTLFRNRSDIVTCCLVCQCQLWLCNLKVLAMCSQRGPLHKRWSPLQFLAIFSGPVTPQEAGANGQQAPQAQYVGQMLAKITIWLILLRVQSTCSENVPQIALELTQAVCIYTFVGFIYDGLEVFLTYSIGLRIAPQFDKPFLADSLANFWGRRWNLPVGMCLRQTIYDPICEGQLSPSKQPGKKAKPSAARRLVALSASFAVSGIAHEAMFWYVMGQHTPRWKWLMFFTIQAPMIAAERIGSKALQQRGMRVPAWLSIPLTLTTLMLTAHVLFFSVWYETEFADILNISLNNDLQTIVSMFKA